MGRVRRYKKYKACDPYSKSSSVNDKDTGYDEPPELFDERSKNSKKRKMHDWDDEVRRELILQQQAKREMRESSSAQPKTSAESKIQPKRDNESLREFKKRVREQTRNTLNEELKKLSSTAKKRKEKMKERNLKRHAKKSGNNNSDDENENEFYQAENGTIRPSDRGTSTTRFASAEALPFNTQPIRPPELKQFNLIKPKYKEKLKLQQAVAKSSVVVEEEDAEKASANDKKISYELEMEKLRAKVQEAYQKVKEKRRLENEAKYGNKNNDNKKR